MIMLILVVEDDLPLLKVIRTVLEDESFEVDAATTGNEGLMMAELGIHDLFIFDIMLPQMSGLTILKKLKAKSINTPTLFLTAKDSVESKVQGLNAGADDYLVKPFAVEELLARIRSLLRRVGKLEAEGQLRYGTITLSIHERDAYIGDSSLNLTTKEYELLQYLIQNREQILTREQIFNRVWGVDSDTGDSVVDLYIHYVRKKLSLHDCEQIIRTIRGAGYMLKEN
jgi:two-component system, OmpR family, response regulator CiaR